MLIKRSLATVAVGSALSFAAIGSANAASILYFSDYSLGTDQMAAALAAAGGSHTVTTAGSLGLFSTLLGGGGFDVAVFFQQNSSGSNYDNAWTAIGTHLADGGAAIGADWTRTAGHVSSFGAGFTGETNDATVTLTDTSLLPGIVNPVALSNPGWSAFSTGLTGSSCAATFSDGDCAIVSGNDGRSLFFGFLNDAVASQEQGVQLFTNALNAVIEPTASVPVPGTAVLLSLGLAGVGVASRRRQ